MNRYFFILAFSGFCFMLLACSKDKAEKAAETISYASAINITVDNENPGLKGKVMFIPVYEGKIDKIIWYIDGVKTERSTSSNQLQYTFLDGNEHTIKVEAVVGKNTLTASKKIRAILKYATSAEIDAKEGPILNTKIVFAPVVNGDFDEITWFVDDVQISVSSYLADKLEYTFVDVQEHTFKLKVKVGQNELTATKTLKAIKASKVIVAYVTSWTNVMPDPRYVTHINYAFGHVTNNFRGVRIDEPERFQKIVALKKNNPSLKVLLSIGGWGSGKFSEMAADAGNRKSFADDCLRVIDEFQLDGVDIDWEFPTSSSAGISSSPDDTKNYTLLMAEIRKSIGNSKLLTLASVVSGHYVDFAKINPYVDFVNIMGYDISGGTQHHSGLYRSGLSGYFTVDEGVKAHVSKGFPINKLVMGVPFYGHGKKGSVKEYIEYKDIVKLNGFSTRWDNVAKASYLVNGLGEFVCTYDSPEAIAIKCQYIKDNNLLGAMYWDYAGDTDDGVLRRAVFSGLSE